MSTLPQKLQPLNLTTLSRHREQTLADAVNAHLSFAATLERLLDLELEARRKRALERRFPMSRLAARPSSDSFHFSPHKSRRQARARILRLLDLDFLRQGAHLVFVGNPDPATL